MRTGSGAPASAFVYHSSRDRLAQRVSKLLAPTLYQNGDREGGIAPGGLPIEAAVAEGEFFLHVFSITTLTDEEAAFEIAEMLGQSQRRNGYIERGVPIFLVEATGEPIDPRGRDTQRGIFRHWHSAAERIELELSQRDRRAGWPAPKDGRLRRRRAILETITRFLRIVSSSPRLLVTVPDLDAIDDHLRIALATLQSSATGGPAANPAAGGGSSMGIVVRSQSDPADPEFPPFSPQFPATPTTSLHVEELGRRILVKDESQQFTGSHKARMAWEVVVFYRDLIEDRLAAGLEGVPSPSLISNGSAAMAVQLMLRCFGLPDLNVLMDTRTDPRVPATLRSLGCEVFFADLAADALDSRSILAATDNPQGIDLTDRWMIDPISRSYYDWLSYEVFNSGARHVFVPVGTGDLFANILRVLTDQVLGIVDDKRLTVPAASLADLNVYGATPRHRETGMTTLFAAHRPSLEPAEELASNLRRGAVCGAHTEIHEVDAAHVDRALSIAHANGIRCNASGIAGLCLLLDVIERVEIPADDEILVVNTGWMPLPVELPCLITPATDGGASNGHA